MWKNAKWLGIPRAELEEKRIFHGDLTGRFAYYRCEADLPTDASLVIDISANSRYRLYINGEPVLSGPCKGDRNRQYFETVSVTDRLREGRNVFCAQVLYCDPDAVEIETAERAAIYGVVGRQCGHRLAVEGDVKNAAGETVGTITTGTADWRVFLDGSYYLTSDENTQFLGAIIEHVDAERSPLRWKEADFDFGAWRPAEALLPSVADDPFRAVGVVPLFRMREREIPLLYERKAHFARCFDREGRELPLLREGFISVPAGARAEILLDAGGILNAYPRFSFEGGRGAKVSITYFEKFGGPGSDLVRSDIRGEITGITDSVTLDGKPLSFEPFWVRTFRFIRILVEGAENETTVLVPAFRKTGYPLPVESSVSSSAPWVEKLWEICVRTLKNCMLETYMDCPYYEQLQYGMDTRLEAQYTYAVSRDKALVRKALVDFHYGMQPEGLNAGKAPSAYLQILSTFSLHYIFLLCEYAREEGDPGVLHLCRGDIDRILDAFDARIGQDGLVGKLDFWNFADWNDAWNETAGAPGAIKAGPSAIINLMYAYALGEAASFMEAQGRPGLAEEYRARRKAILDAVETLCWDAEAGLYREGPHFQQFSRHAQAWAVLNGMKEGKAAAGLLLRARERGDVLTCSFSASYEWFRALEKAGLYDEMRQELNPWIGLIDLDCTCCPETPKGARSECHAWSALPLYELIRTIAGVHAGKDGSVLIAPHMTDLPDLKGQAATAFGPVSFDYGRDADGKRRYEVTLPEGMSGVFRFPDGREKEISAGTNLLAE